MKTEAITPREREVWALVVAGYVKKEIASILKRSIHTVSMLIRRLFIKLCVHKETDLVREWFVINWHVDRADLKKMLNPPQTLILLIIILLNI
jgi:DNA-binding CsgD family transcriptional regulator